MAVVVKSSNFNSNLWKLRIVWSDVWMNSPIISGSCLIRSCSWSMTPWETLCNKTRFKPFSAFFLFQSSCDSSPCGSEACRSVYNENDYECDCSSGSSEKPCDKPGKCSRLYSGVGWGGGILKRPLLDFRLSNMTNWKCLILFAAPFGDFPDH